MEPDQVKGQRLVVPFPSVGGPRLRGASCLFSVDITPQEWDLVDRYVRNYIALREDAGPDDE